jgi:hypothetical protein
MIGTQAQRIIDPLVRSPGLDGDEMPSPSLSDRHFRDAPLRADDVPDARAGAGEILAVPRGQRRSNSRCGPRATLLLASEGRFTLFDEGANAFLAVDTCRSVNNHSRLALHL